MGSPTQAGVTIGDVPVGGVLVPDDVLTASNARIIFESQATRAGRMRHRRPRWPALFPKPSIAPLTGVAVAAMPAPATTADASAEVMVRSELFLGMSRQDGRGITEAEVSVFVDGEVIPRFPAGTTQVSADGTYGSRVAGVIHEPSRLLTILPPERPREPHEDSRDCHGLPHPLPAGGGFGHDESGPGVQLGGVVCVESVTIGVHPWLRCFTSRLCVERITRTSGTTCQPGVDS